MTEAAPLAVKLMGIAERRRVVTSAWWPTAIAMGLGTAIILFAHRATVSEFVSLWSNAASYKVAWAVLPTVIYLLWHNREHLFRHVPTAGPAGVVAAAFCTVLWIASDLLDISAGRQFALLGAFYALVFAGVGRRVFRALLPFLAMLLFLAPTGQFLLEPLKYSAVAFTQMFTTLAGLPIETAGFAMTVGTKDYVIIDDCAGLPYVLIGLFFGLSLSLLIYRSWWKIAALTLFGGLLAAVANWIRIASIITYDYLMGTELTVAQHFYLELPAMTAACAVLFYVFAKLQREPGARAAGAASSYRGGARLKSIWFILIAAALISSAPLISASSLPAFTVTGPATLLPPSLLGWKQSSLATDWTPRVQKKSTLSSVAGYEENGRRISVFLAQSNSEREKVSGRAVDFVGSPDWLSSVQRVVSACSESRCHDFQYVKLHLRNSRRVRHLYVVYALGSETKMSPLGLRAGRAWHRLTGSPVPARAIAIAVEDTTTLSTVEVAALIEGLITENSAKFHH